MQIVLTTPIIQRLRRELRRAGRNEIGGLLMGEHVKDDTFRIIDISVQRSGGSQVHFVRDPAQHQTQLHDFFARTRADYARFNYLGEWHSHPSFEPLPSDTDISTMQSIVEDPAVGVNFLVLVIPRLDQWKQMRLSAMLFRRGADPTMAAMSVEGASGSRAGNIVTAVLRKLLNR